MATSTPTSVTFAAGGESMTAGAGCSGTGPVACEFDPVTDYVDVLLEDGNDTFDASAVTDDLGLYVDGGAGDDVINLRDGVTDVGADCGADFDLVLLDPTERSWTLPGCENQQPTIALVRMSPPRVGLVATMSGGAHQTVGPATALVTRQWYTCVTLDRQGCSSLITGDSFTPQASDLGRYLFARISLSLAEFAFFGPVEWREAVPSQIRAAPTVGIPRPPSNSFVLGAFKTGSSPTATFFAGPGRVVVRNPAGTKKSKRYVKKVSWPSPGSPIKIAVKLTAAGKKRLTQDRKLKVRVSVAFLPNGGTERTKSVWATFKLKPKKKPS